MSHRVNFHRRRLHHTVYYTLDSNKELLIILLFHVDDFLVAFREDCHFDEGLFMFIFGQKNLVDDDDFVLKGKTVSFKKVEGEFHIQVMQKAFIGETRKLKPNRLWIPPSTILVEILGKQNSVYSENLALLTGATHFTMSSVDDKLIQSASRAIHALNHRPPTAGMSLDEVGGTSELEGCEEFYHPAGGWTDGWRDVAKTLKSAQT
ncbi:hypothetical protein AK812_SmicGene1642 [Symbiodinium microadriaticum]|uniref:Uncharacterized protein n=1 Tax=Symbiodinium microadriaticum TaxID=2951 RepID=A0A1Q9F3J4_SYMMI|nr:hypothetical protein AK812_SmicGene1642 [Symbiodinium microadriaticum]